MPRAKVGKVLAPFLNINNKLYRRRDFFLRYLPTQVDKTRVNKVGIGIGTVGIPPRLVGSIHTCIYLIVTWNVRVDFVRARNQIVPLPSLPLPYLTSYPLVR